MDKINLGGLEHVIVLTAEVRAALACRVLIGLEGLQGRVPALHAVVQEVGRTSAKGGAGGTR
eukprot:542250-Hanusia_phi.AAC.4